MTMNSRPASEQPHDDIESAAQASRAGEFFAGVKAELPILLGVIPFGLIYGALAIASGLDALAAQAMSVIIFAGSAQFITTELIAQATPWLIVIVTGAVVNLRHMLYSASLAPYVQHLPWRWKAGLAYLLTDEAYAVAITRYQRADRGGPHGHWHFLGAGTVLWATWQASTAAGVFLGALVPDAWSLDFALPLTFIAIVAPALKDRPSVAAALAAGAVAVFGFALPLRLSLVTATVCGISAGLLVERWATRRTAGGGR
jgi:4-azaleucine resistance transporter AzlC